MSEITITEADVNSFRDKLDTWTATLTEGERAILAVLTGRAFPEESDPEVAGFDKHKEWIEVSSFSWGQANLGTAGTGGGTGAGAVRLSQVAFGGIDSLLGSRVIGRP